MDYALDSIKKWIDGNIAPLQSDDATEEDGEKYLAGLMAVLVTTGIIQRKDKATVSEVLSDIRRMDRLWVEAGKYMVFKYNVPLMRYGCLILLKLIKFPNDEDDSIFQSALNEYVEELDSGVERKFDPNNNPDAIKEYFAILKELEVFYQNPEQYDSEEKQKKSERLLELYRAMMFK